MQTCSIYFRTGSILIVSESQTEEGGPYYGIGPMFKVESLTPLQIGRAILNALSASRNDIPDPADFKALQQRLLQFLGVQRWGQVARTFKYAGVERDESIVTITPHRVGQAASFVPDGEPTQCQQTDVECIGRGVLSALKIKDLPRE